MGQKQAGTSNIASITYHPVMDWGGGTVVLDFSGEPQVNRIVTPGVITIGRYAEHRPHLYIQDLFGATRTIHMGIDLGAPAGTPVYAFDDGCILHRGVNPKAGDYGGVIVTEHCLGSRPIYALYGHLKPKSLESLVPGSPVRKGQTLAILGSESENGGWPPHLHFQLSWVRPSTHDLPGVVAIEDLPQALLDYPDPRIVLGPIYY